MTGKAADGGLRLFCLRGELSACGTLSPALISLIVPYLGSTYSLTHVLQGREKKFANLAKLSLQILLSYSQAGPGRKTKQGQEEISRNHVQRLFLGSVQSNQAQGEFTCDRGRNLRLDLTAHGTADCMVGHGPPAPRCRSVSEKRKEGRRRI